MSEYAAMIFAQSAKQPHEPQQRTARTATSNRTNRNREPHEPQPRTARTVTANRTNRDRTACVKLLLGSTVQRSPVRSNITLLMP